MQNLDQDRTLVEECRGGRPTFFVIVLPVVSPCIALVRMSGHTINRAIFAGRNARSLLVFSGRVARLWT